jgi:hypothetical protein
VTRTGNADLAIQSSSNRHLPWILAFMDRTNNYNNRLNKPNKVSLDSSVGIVARLRAEHTSNRRSITDRSKI